MALSMVAIRPGNAGLRFGLEPVVCSGTVDWLQTTADPTRRKGFAGGMARCEVEANHARAADFQGVWGRPSSG